jgi:spermidine/putrescine transport system substrate-binding protein
MKRTIMLALTCAMLLAGCHSKRQKLYVFNWSDYISKDLIAEFEKKNHCDVIYDTYDSNENMLTRIQHSHASYDITAPSSDHVVIMTKAGLLEPLDMSKLPHYANLDPAILEKCKDFDPNNQYAIPYFWGLTGLIYNKKYIPAEKLQDVSWDILADPMFAGKRVVTMLDDPRDAIGAALIYAGYNPNDISDVAIAKAREAILRWDKNVSQYDSESYKNEVPGGNTYSAEAYNGDALQVMKENPDVGFVIPREGCEMWIDSMVILRSAENKDLAYKFIDFLLEAENARRNAEFVQYATPNATAYKMLTPEARENRLIYPDSLVMSRCHPLGDIGDNIVKIDKVWEEVRNNRNQ